MVKLDLTKDGKKIICLTDNTIKKLNIVTTKTRRTTLIPLTEDIELFIKMENATIDEWFMTEKDEEGKEEEIPREVDSVRLLCDYALATYRSRYCYLDGAVEIIDGFTQSVSRYKYKDLFVMKFDEEYVEDTKDTLIYVLLREKARNRR